MDWLSMTDDVAKIIAALATAAAGVAPLAANYFQKIANHSTILAFRNEPCAERQGRRR